MFDDIDPIFIKKFVFLEVGKLYQVPLSLRRNYDEKMVTTTINDKRYTLSARADKNTIL
ncbi:hypothetical protein IGI01_19105 [Bacillus thuringiensis]|nr:hypothetical protein [Bacillus thuringiensis]